MEACELASTLRRSRRVEGATASSLAGQRKWCPVPVGWPSPSPAWPRSAPSACAGCAARATRCPTERRYGARRLARLGCQNRNLRGPHALPSWKPRVARSLPCRPLLNQAGSSGSLMRGLASVFFGAAPPDEGHDLSRMRDAMANRRLSGADLSDAARQPMANEHGTVRVTFNGEVYDLHSLREPSLPGQSGTDPC